MQMQLTFMESTKAFLRNCVIFLLCILYKHFNSTLMKKKLMCSKPISLAL